MDDIIQRAQRALSYFHYDSRGCNLSGDFNELHSHLRIDPTVPEAVKMYCCPLLDKIQDDLWNLSGLVERLEVIRTLTAENEDLKNRWPRFVQLDVDHFHMDYSSILDYVAQIIACCSEASGKKLPKEWRKSKSFPALMKVKNSNSEQIAPFLLPLLDNTGWFDEIRRVRNRIIHSGAMAIVFMDPAADGILFQVLDTGLSGLVRKPYLLYNKNVAYFDRYVAVYFTYLLTFLEDLAKTIINHFSLKASSGSTKVYSPGFIVIEKWTSALVLLLQQQNSVAG